MTLRRSYDNEDEIPEGVRDQYVESGGKWVLDLEGDGGDKTADDVRRALQARDREREVAASLRREMEALKAKLEGVDLDHLPDAMDALKQRDELEQQRLISEKKFEEAAEQKYKRQIAEMTRQLDSLKQAAERETQQREQLFADYRKVRINEALGKEFVSAGIDPDFLDAALHMEAQRWEIDPETREPVPIEKIDNGRTTVTATGADGKPLTMKEHAATFLRDRPRWALSSSGSNSAHQNGSGANQYRISETDARDIRKWEAVRERAQKAGTDIEIVPG